MKQQQSIHGHEVMQMMIASGISYTRETLRQAMAEQFGPDARYHTCSAQAMTADALIDFLAARGKFADATDGNGFQTDPSKICDH